MQALLRAPCTAWGSDGRPQQRHAPHLVQNDPCMALHCSPEGCSPVSLAGDLSMLTRLTYVQHLHTHQGPHGMQPGVSALLCTACPTT